MTPQDLAAAKALADLISTIGAWPLGLVCIIIALGPWGVLFFVVRTLDKRAAEHALAAARQAADHELATARAVAEIREVVREAMKIYEGKHAEVVRMYENNVELVRTVAKVAQDEAGIIHLNTQAMTRLVDHIEKNFHCPLSRAKG